MTSEVSDPTACSARPDTRSILVTSAGGGRDVVIRGAHGTWRINPASTGSAPVTPAR